MAQVARTSIKWRRRKIVHVIPMPTDATSGESDSDGEWDFWDGSSESDEEDFANGPIGGGGGGTQAVSQAGLLETLESR